MRRCKRFLVGYCLVCSFVGIFPNGANPSELLKGFVYVKDVIPGIQVELRYSGNDNFVGRRVDGYVKPRCILTKQAAHALRKVQHELKRFGLGLKIYDAYRPQRAVQDFVRWATDPKDTKMKKRFYPTVKKRNLFERGYIAKKSSHSRGSAVDLTIVSLKAPSFGTELDMGSIFDFFGAQSHAANQSIGPGPRAHRLLLQTLMKKHGFAPYEKEWWHFKLRNEPYPNTYFDFPVQ